MGGPDSPPDPPRQRRAITEARWSVRGPSLSASDIREKLEQVVDGEAEGDHRARITTVDQSVEMFVLVQELDLHGVPNGLVQILFLAQMLFHFLVQQLDVLLHVLLGIFVDHFAQFLSAEEERKKKKK